MGNNNLGLQLASDVVLGLGKNSLEGLSPQPEICCDLPTGDSTGAELHGGTPCRCPSIAWMWSEPLHTKEMSGMELNLPSNTSTSVGPSLPQDLIILGSRHLTLSNTSV